MIVLHPSFMYKKILCALVFLIVIQCLLSDLFWLIQANIICFSIGYARFLWFKHIQETGQLQTAFNENGYTFKLQFDFGWCLGFYAQQKGLSKQYYKMIYTDQIKPVQLHALKFWLRTQAQLTC